MNSVIYSNISFFYRDENLTISKMRKLDPLRLQFDIVNPTLPVEGFKAVGINYESSEPIPDDFREMGNLCAGEIIKAIQAGKFAEDLERLVSVD